MGKRIEGKLEAHAAPYGKRSVRIYVFRSGDPGKVEHLDTAGDYGERIRQIIGGYMELGATNVPGLHAYYDEEARLKDTPPNMRHAGAKGGTGGVRRFEGSKLWVRTPILRGTVVFMRSNGEGESIDLTDRDLELIGSIE